MKRIPLTQGKEALVDDQDYDYLMQWKWRVTSNGYAVWGDGHEHLVLMHRDIAKRTYQRCEARVDHIDRDRLNNQRHNLRLATQSENGANRGPNRNNTSGFKGVFLHRHTGLWRAEICKDRKRICLGYFTDKIEAAKAYNEAALKYFGEFAYLNPV